jgi:hypothetical protein
LAEETADLSWFISPLISSYAPPNSYLKDYSNTSSSFDSNLQIKNE